MTASRLAEVGAGDPQPLELGGLGQHPLEQLLVGGLAPRTLSEIASRRRDPRREGVPDPLELPEADQTRLPRSGRDARIDRETREGLRREPAQLCLETADLAAQLNAGETLVAVYASAKESVSVEQLLHDPTRV